MLRFRNTFTLAVLPELGLILTAIYISPFIDWDGDQFDFIVAILTAMLTVVCVVADVRRLQRERREREREQYWSARRMRRAAAKEYWRRYRDAR